MGYRSDVALALTSKGVDHFKTMLDSDTTSPAAREQVPRLLGWADKHLVEDDGSESWYWELIKWYKYRPEDFADVDFFERLMGELDEEDYYFVRIGEDNDDSEVRGAWIGNPFGITFCREIVFDC